MKKVICIFLIIQLLILSIPISAEPNKVNYEKQAQTLQSLGLFRGSTKGFELDRDATRVEAAITILRLLGKEEEALAKKLAHPFSDVPAWAQYQIAYMYKNGLIKGIGGDKFGAASIMDTKSFCTLVLRALNYNDGAGDFSWATALTKAKDIQLFNSDEEKNILKSNNLSRDNMVLIAHNALSQKLKGSTKTLAEKLIDEGIIKKEQLAGSHVSIPMKTRIEYSNYRVEMWGIHTMKIDISTLPEGLRNIHKVAVSGTSTPYDNGTVAGIINSDRHKQSIGSFPIYNTTTGSEFAVYSKSLILLFNKDDECIAFANVPTQIKMGVIEVEFIPYKHQVMNLVEIKAGIEADSEGYITIDKSKLPNEIKDFSSYSLFHVNAPLTNHDSNSLPFIEGRRRDSLAYNGQKISIEEALKPYGVRGTYLYVYLYDGKGNYGYYTLNIEKYVEKLAEIKKEELARDNIVEVKEGITIKTIGNQFEALINREQLPKEVQNFKYMANARFSKYDNVILYASLLKDTKMMYDVYPSTGFKTTFEKDYRYMFVFTDENKKVIGYYVLQLN